ncbi:uncharacterized protein ELE39_000267 [Cryptosporidium sp. chipmunk genotype I]|uniref:uncharacterized protein n=1 Tax=Cryptosporidium sp. chipmunk genotype I TaxID=1280935 RepID=UPI00351A76F4|nr:hypothetical protein ELE39_000267 [Cryptosporidium sp. chipmunk genotype I]
MCYLGSSTHGKCCCCIPLGVSGTITSLILLTSGIFTTCQFSQTPNQEIGGLTSSALFTGVTLLSFLCFYCGPGGAGFAYFSTQFTAIVVTFQIIYQWCLWSYSFLQVGHLLIGFKMAFIITLIWIVTLIVNIISITIFRSTWEIKIQGGSTWNLKNAQEVRLKNLENAVGL